MAAGPLSPPLPCTSAPRAGNRRGEEVKRQERMSGTAATREIIGFYEAERTQTERERERETGNRALTQCN